MICFHRLKESIFFIFAKEKTFFFQQKKFFLLGKKQISFFSKWNKILYFLNLFFFCYKKLFEKCHVSEKRWSAKLLFKKFLSTVAWKKNFFKVVRFPERDRICMRLNVNFLWYQFLLLSLWKIQRQTFWRLNAVMDSSSANDLSRSSNKLSVAIFFLTNHSSIFAKSSKAEHFIDYFQVANESIFEN